MFATNLNAAVIGLGLIGKEHVRVYSEHPIVNLAAVVDVDTKHATEIGEEYNVEHVGEDLQEALNATDLDLVTVATPEKYHLEPTLTALENGCNVLLEKPIASEMNDALDICRAAKSADTELMIGYLCRFDPRYARLKEELAEFGDLLTLHAARISSNWGYFRRGADSHPEYYLGIHDIDMLRWFVDAEVEWVHAQGSKGLGDIDTPAIVSSLLGFEDDTIATLETNWARTQKHPSALTAQIRVTGTEGYGELSFETTGDDVTVATNEEGFYYGEETSVHGERQDFLRREIDHFVDCSRNDRTPLVTWESGLRSLEVVHAIMDSIDSGEQVAVEHRQP